MKVVILAGGMGTRISEESVYKPKPLIEIGERPILWHIMKIYSHYGYNDFVILGGYKQEMIKKYFQDYFFANCDLTFRYSDDACKCQSGYSVEICNENCEKWNVTIVDTGLDTMTGGRLKRIKQYIGNEPFLLTYGDGVSDVNIKELVEQHKRSDALVTLTAYQPEQNFGILEFGEGKSVSSFKEKVKEDSYWINAGYMVVEPAAIDYIEDDLTPWEQHPLRTIAADGKLEAYRHNGFWKCMDTLKHKTELEEIWNSGKAPWKVWKK